MSTVSQRVFGSPAGRLPCQIQLTATTWSCLMVMMTVRTPTMMQMIQSTARRCSSALAFVRLPRAQLR
jgi:hypothetical protein